MAHDLIERMDGLRMRADGLGDRMDEFAVKRRDANFEENKHPRAEDGKFGSGGGAAKGGKDAPKKNIVEQMKPHEKGPDAGIQAKAAKHEEAAKAAYKTGSTEDSHKAVVKWRQALTKHAKAAGLDHTDAGNAAARIQRDKFREWDKSGGGGDESFKTEGFDRK